MIRLILIIVTFFIMYLSLSNSQDLCTYASGSTIIANDGKYLGKVSSRYDSESILNTYGSYGSEYSSDSIWNKYSSYGSEYSNNSPFNSYSSTPPVLVKKWKSNSLFKC